MEGCDKLYYIILVVYDCAVYYIVLEMDPSTAASASNGVSSTVVGGDDNAKVNGGKKLRRCLPLEIAVMCIVIAVVWVLLLLPIFLFYSNPVSLAF